MPNEDVEKNASQEEPEVVASTESESPVGETLTELEQLKAELDDTKAKAEEYRALVQRVQADFDNFRRRARQEKEDSLKYGAGRLVENMLPILDNFERALSAEGQDLDNFLAGVSLILRQFKETLAKEGVTPIEALGTEFDPTMHEAVMSVDSPDHADNTVVEELQKGYCLHDKVIRPAMVKVCKNC